jgi:predicted TIM-barrel fold metal-dependent hydrolase
MEKTMKINSHCHIFSLDCVPEEFRERFSLNFENPLDRIFFWLIESILPEGSKPEEFLELADLTTLEIALRLIREMDEVSIDLCTPLMMDMEFCNSFQAGEIKDFMEQLNDTEFAAETVNKKYGRTRMLPFIAVDPRRQNILDILKDKIPADKGKRKVFWGVKFYPPMGYKPIGNDKPKLDKTLREIYAYCQQNNIPTTTHCLNGGIPGLKQEDYELANPKYWQEVLEEYPDLTLNLAHNDRTRPRWQRAIDDLIKISSSWQDKIEELIRTYKNVYTDVAFNTEMWYMPKDYFENVKRLLEDEVTSKKLLYGTDWYMGRFLWTEETYFKWFSEYSKRIPWCRVYFSNQELKRLIEDNPKRFLGLT